MERTCFWVQRRHLTAAHPGGRDAAQVIEMFTHLAELADAQRALDAEREKVKEYMTNYVPLKALEDVEAQLATLQAQLRQVEGDRQTLRQLVEVHTKQLTELTIIPIGCSREQELRWTQSIKDLRAALADVDAALQPERGRND